MNEYEERLYFAVHGLEPTTAQELNAKLEAALARDRKLAEDLDLAAQTEGSSRDGCSGDCESDQGR